MTRLTRALAITSTLLGLTYVASADDQKGERTLSLVHFDYDSATPTDDLLMAANQLACNPNETIILDAYTDPAGSEEYNIDLAMRRAGEVRDRLVEFGIERDRIMIGIFGENGPRHEKHAYDRRVEIRTSDEPVATLQQRRQDTAVAVVSPGQELEQVGRR